MIRCLKDSDGVQRDGRQEVETAVTSNLKKVFSTQDVLSTSEELNNIIQEIDLTRFTSSQDQNVLLPLSPLEIRTTMFSMKGSKSPIPYCMPVEFLRDIGGTI